MIDLSTYALRLIADTLHCEPIRATPLAQLVHQRTAGNPFFATQFITALAEEELLRFDHASRSWVWDVSRIGSKGYTDNVVDLIVGKLNRLPVETQKTLKEFASLGSSAEINTLCFVRGASEEEVQSDLSEALRLEFVVRLDGSYKFVHDRIQEAAYSLIPEELRAETHLRIGRLLNAQTSPERCKTQELGLIRRMLNESLMPFILPKTAAWAWGYRSVVRLLKVMADGSGPCRTMAPAQRFNLLFDLVSQVYRRQLSVERYLAYAFAK